MSYYVIINKTENNFFDLDIFFLNSNIYSTAEPVPLEIKSCDTPKS